MPGGSKPKRAGAAYEAAVRDFLKRWWPDCERPALWGSRDRGDLINVPGWVIQCRCTPNRVDLAGAIEDAKVQAANNGGGRPVAVIKRKNHGVARSYVVLELETWAEIACP
jgi:hypothetical protein